MPTYQTSKVGHVRTDSKCSNRYIINQFVASLKSLSKLAVAHQAHVIVKLHPMDFLNDVEASVFENITVFSRGNPLPYGISLYDALSVADGLITDMSSVSFDFMVTKKPLLITRWVFNKYIRNLCFDPALLYDATYTCDNWNGANVFFNAVHKGAEITNKHVDFFCEYKDSGSCERLSNQLSSLSKGKNI